MRSRSSSSFTPSPLRPPQRHKCFLQVRPPLQGDLCEPLGPRVVPPAFLNIVTFSPTNELKEQA
eukprot:4375037-Pyramimonas_sp.AAC.1